LTFLIENIEVKTKVENSRTMISETVTKNLDSAPTNRGFLSASPFAMEI
jgi:hypothetical protein